MEESSNFADVFYLLVEQLGNKQLLFCLCKVFYCTSATPFIGTAPLIVFFFLPIGFYATRTDSFFVPRTCIA